MIIKAVEKKKSDVIFRNRNRHNIKDQVYIILCTLFSVLLVVSNLTYQKFASLPILPFYTFELSVGAIFYPVSYMLSDLMAEFYGKEKASFCVKLSVGMNLIVALIVLLFINISATSWSNIDDATFEKMFGPYTHNFIGSILATYIAQRVDIFIYLYFKKITHNKMLWARAFISTSISLFFDTVVVISFLTITGIFAYDKMWGLIMNSYSFKLFFSAINIPIFYIIVTGIRKIKTF